MSLTPPVPIPIPYSDPYWTTMTQLVHGIEALNTEGYKLEGYRDEEILGMRRCGDCHARIRTRKSKKDKDATNGNGDENKGDKAATEERADAENDEDEEDGGVEIVTVTEKTTPKIEPATMTEKGEAKQKGRRKKKNKRAACQFHTGRVINKHFTCCQERVSDPGCVERDQHSAVEYAPGELESEWALHATPNNKTKKEIAPRRAVALDCEMGVSIYGEPELVRISLVDFFTGEILIDSLVYPHVRLLHLNTRYSGVTRGMLEWARQRKQCIRGGRDAAREQVWRYVGRETIVVMHGGQSDLLALRWIHGRVIDSFVVESERQRQRERAAAAADAAAGNTSAATATNTAAPGGGRSLKHLAVAILGQQIQRGHRGHDSVEDAMACRWLVDWYVRSQEVVQY